MLTVKIIRSQEFIKEQRSECKNPKNLKPGFGFGYQVKNPGSGPGSGFVTNSIFYALEELFLNTFSPMHANQSDKKILILL